MKRDVRIRFFRTYELIKKYGHKGISTREIVDRLRSEGFEVERRAIYSDYYAMMELGMPVVRKAIQHNESLYFYGEALEDMRHEIKRKTCI